MSRPYVDQIFLRLTFALALLVVLSGCGREKTVPVSGTVTLDGEPIGPGTIIFTPTTEGAPSAMGSFGADGRYQLSTFDSNDGAVLGSHRVIIQASSLSESEFGNEEIIDSRIPLIYADPQQSGLTAEVNPDSDPIDFDLHDDS